MQYQETLLPPQSSTIAPAVDALFYFIFYTGLIIFMIVLLGLIFFAFRYRRRRAEKIGLTSGVDKNTKLELLWSIIPTILVIIVFAWGFQTYLKMNVPPKDAVEIKVTGKQWLWIFDYPDGGTSVNELVVPVNQPVKLLMSSEDVIHSFFVPNFRIKMDLLPNRYTVTWFEATEVGKHDILCAEYCGEGHSRMLGTVTVLSESEYLTWKESGAYGMDESIPSEDFGLTTYTKKGCNTCHSIDGRPMVGPSMKDLFGREEKMTDGTTQVVDENYLRQSILEPMAHIVDGYQPVMPTYQGLMSTRELDAIIAYIKSLNSK
jgi:cytochrome c oxidase subunit 2